MNHDTRTHYRFALVDGQKVFYREAGQPGQPVMLLLHGFPSSSHMFRDLIPRLADRFHVIAPDMIGFGHSDAPPAQEFEYSFSKLTDVTEQLLASLGIERYHLYMQDYGGPIGLRLAERHPERVLGLIVQNANAYMEGVSQAAMDVFMPLWQNNDETGARQMLQATITRWQYTAGARAPEALNPDAWTHDQAMLDRPGSEARQMALFRDYQTNVERYSQWHEYFRKHQPKTLVTWGKTDPFFTPAGATAFTRDLRQIEVHLLDSGHFALEEDVDVIADHIRRYF